MRKRNIIYLFLIFLVIALYYYVNDPQSDNRLPVAIDTTNTPTYQSQAMQTVVYDPTGKLFYQIEAKQIAHYGTTRDTQFTQPNVTLYEREKNAVWHIYADKALLTKEHMLYLDGHVQLDNLSPQAQIQQIVTEQAQVNLTTQIVTSDAEVTLKGAGFYSSGHKLYGDLRAKTANLLENVKTYYQNPAS